MSSNKRKAGISLLKAGYSYSQIQKELQVSKGTINFWFKSLDSKDQILVKRFRLQNWKKSYKDFADKKKKKTLGQELIIQDKAARRINSVSLRELFLIGIALYWGEGTKSNRWGLQFSNSDPEMISLMMKFFRQVCGVKEEKFYMQMILHKNIKEKKALDYWSKVAKIPKNQFKKACFSLSRSSKKIRRKNKLPYGTLQIRVHDKILTHKIYGYLKGLKNAGVVQ